MCKFSVGHNIKYASQFFKYTYLEVRGVVQVFNGYKSKRGLLTALILNKIPKEFQQN